VAVKVTFPETRLEGEAERVTVGRGLTVMDPVSTVDKFNASVTVTFKEKVPVRL
jgi:hypothetical protein